MVSQVSLAAFRATIMAHWNRPREDAQAFARIEATLLALHRKVDEMARTEQELSDDLDKIATGVAAAVAEITDLKNQIADLQAGSVTQAQLDALTAKADGVVTSLGALTPTA